jgi:hypothetical protein
MLGEAPDDARDVHDRGAGRARRRGGRRGAGAHPRPPRRAEQGGPGLRTRLRRGDRTPRRWSEAPRADRRHDPPQRAGPRRRTGFPAGKPVLRRRGD